MRLAVFVMILPIILCVGCSSTTNVTDDTRYQGGFKKGQVYKAMRPLSLNVSNRVEGFGEGNTAAVRRGAIKEGNRNAYKGIIEKGERLQIVKIEYLYIPTQYAAVTPFAKVLDGKFRGEVVDIYSITKYLKGKRTPDQKVQLRTAKPEFLQRAR